MSRIGYNIKQAFTQIGRNKGMSGVRVRHYGHDVDPGPVLRHNRQHQSVHRNGEDRLRPDRDLSGGFHLRGGSQQIMDAVESHDHVKQVEYRSKEDALKILKKRWGESGYLLDSLGDNPLPNSLLVTVESLEAPER